MFPPSPDAGAVPLVSRFAGDPEMADLVRFFLDELPVRMESLKAAWESRERRLLGRLAHQLRGAGAGYGFPEIRDAASQVEERLRAATSDLQQAEASVRELLDLCSRACMGQ